MAEAKASATADENYVRYAKADAELLDWAVVLPLTSNGGNYAIARVAHTHDTLCINVTG